MIRCLLIAIFMITMPAIAIAGSRIKDITDVQGIRENQLVGYGLVIGLAGTGDTMRNSPFTEQSARSMLQRLGVGVPPGSIRRRTWPPWSSQPGFLPSFLPARGSMSPSLRSATQHP